MVDSCQGVGRGTGGGDHLKVFFFFTCAFVFCFSCAVSFLSE